MLRNAVELSYFLEESITKVYDSMLLALRGGGWVGVKFPEKNVTV